MANHVFDVVMPFITDPRHWTLPLLAYIFFAIRLDEKRGRIALGILILTLALTDSIAAQWIKPLVGRIRPSHALDGIRLLVGKGGRYSFVSNHAANSFALSTVLGYFYPRVRPWLYTLAGLIAFSRVYVGVHYPADIVGGALFGYGMAWLVLSAWVILKMRELKRGRTWVWYADSFPPGIE
ncbi:MAG: phosphatase PAP2 family protein [Fidelibacterota bacterium]